MRPRRAFVALVVLPTALAAQDPLSAIDWLNANPGTPVAPIGNPHTLIPSGIPSVIPFGVPDEPPVASGVASSEVTVSPLGAAEPLLGLVPQSVTGLTDTLWLGSDTVRLTRQIARVPVYDSPAMQSLLYSLLLTEAQHSGHGRDLTLARLDRLLALGAVEPAFALARRATPENNPGVFKRWFDAGLLIGQEDQGCRVMAAHTHLVPGYDAQVYCAARLGSWQNAYLTLESAAALSLLPADRVALMDRFLNADLYDGADPLPAPRSTDPLGFRVFEAIGERLPTAGLPRAFATADLRDVAGWKAQLEAAERLTRVGALSPNQLLGLYTERLPAASGGIWDRVEALQRFETALSTRSPTAVAKTLFPVWSAMRSVGLEVPFAELYAPELAGQPLLDPRAKDLAWKIRLLSSEYEDAARTPPDTGAMSTYLAALAQGEPGRAHPPNAVAEAISEGFSGETPLPRTIQSALRDGRLGEAILTAMELFASGAKGNSADLSRALTTFRKLGLEDTARRASLHLMLAG
jgi:hypothetical protein